MKTHPKLLVIDDGDRHIELLHHFLRDYVYATRCDLPGPCWTCPQRAGCQLTHAHDAAEADDALRRHPDTDVVLLDVAFDLPRQRLLPLRRTAPPESTADEADDDEPSLDLTRRLQGLAILSHLRRTRDVETLYEDVTDLLHCYQLDVLAFEPMTTPGFVLDHAPDFGTECVHLSVLSRHEGAPVHLNYQYMPSRYAVLLDPRREANTSLLVTLQRNGLRSATVDLNISSAAADLATATRLDVQVGVPLLATRRISRDAQGGVLEYFEALTRPDRYSYSFRFEPGAR